MDPVQQLIQALQDYLAAGGDTPLAAQVQDLLDQATAMGGEEGAGDMTTGPEEGPGDMSPIAQLAQQGPPEDSGQGVGGRGPFDRAQNRAMDDLKKLKKKPAKA